MKMTPVQAREPKPMRRLDGAGERMKLTTRAPYELLEHMPAVAKSPNFGYRSQAEMHSRCLVEFLDQKPWETIPGWSWVPSQRHNDVIRLSHVHLEPVKVVGRRAVMSDRALRNKALKVAEKGLGISQATFVLNFLWWVATHKHRLSNETMALLNPVLPRWAPRTNVDPKPGAAACAPQVSNYAEAAAMLQSLQAFLASRPEHDGKSDAIDAGYNVRMALLGVRSLAASEAPPDHAAALQASMNDVIARARPRDPFGLGKLSKRRMG